MPGFVLAVRKQLVLQSVACVALFLLRILGTVQESSGNCSQRAAVHYFKNGLGYSHQSNHLAAFPKKQPIVFVRQLIPKNKNVSNKSHFLNCKQAVQLGRSEGLSLASSEHSQTQLMSMLALRILAKSVCETEPNQKAPSVFMMAPCNFKTK